MARREVANPDLALNEMEAELVSAKIAEAEGGISSGTPALYAVFSCEMPGYNPNPNPTPNLTPNPTPTPNQVGDARRAAADFPYRRGQASTYPRVAPQGARPSPNHNPKPDHNPSPNANPNPNHITSLPTRRG